MTNVYQENGFDNRDDYLRCLSEDYGLPLSTVLALADVLGEDEDFDGLVTSLAEAELELDSDDFGVDDDGWD